ncbi:MAG: hypothetical protein B7Z24_07735, partial [Pseudomonadales bacterium 32-42-5]
VIANGAIIHTNIKRNLPNYGVFDEQRYFNSARENSIFTWKNYKIGLLICEDMWYEDTPKQLCKLGAQILITINASPYNITKDQQRKKIAKELCLQYKISLYYVNQVGGQDELVFDGGSFAMNTQGEITTQLEYFTNDQFTITNNSSKFAPVPSQMEAIYNALVLSLRDYANKNNFDKLLLGLSGGIDSALVAAIAVDALGRDKLLSVMLPSKYTSDSSKADALAVAKNLGIRLTDLSIEKITDAARFSLATLIDLSPGSITDQNIQARARGLLLMGLSNQLGALLLSTGNKSENAVGYATLYGDMCGGFNPIKDVYKTQVYALATYRKLPQSVITKHPSAELYFNQKDQDTLPDYNLLDKILYHLVEEDLSISAISLKGY